MIFIYNSNLLKKKKYFKNSCQIDIGVFIDVLGV
jgi:hypothetical protein